jgi:hypothetical protein
MSACDEMDGSVPGEPDGPDGAALDEEPGETEAGTLGGEHDVTTSVSRTETGPRKWPLRLIPPIP